MRGVISVHARTRARERDRGNGRALRAGHVCEGAKT